MKKINLNIKKPKLSLLITIIFVVLLLLGTSFAYFLVSGRSLLTKGEIGKISVNYTEGNVIRNNNFIPLTSDEVLEHATKLDFSVTNDGTAKTYVNIEFSDITIADELKSEDTKWSLYQDNNVIATGNFSNVASALSLSKNILFEINDTKNYTVYIWINENGGDQSLMQGKSLSAKMKVYANQRKSMDSRLANYKIYGNSTQETRSGKNLANISNLTNARTWYGSNPITNIDTSTGSFTINYKQFANTEFKLKDLAPNLEAGKTYYLFGNSPSQMKIIYLYGTSESWVYNSSKIITQEMIDGGIDIYGMNTEPYECTISNFMITETNDNNYEPYGVMPSPEFPSEVVSLGENTKNLFDINSATISPSTNGNISDEIYTCNKGFYGSGVFLTISKPIEIDKTYTISFDYMPTNTNSLTAYVGFKKADGSGILNEYIHATALNEWSHFSVTKTITSEVEQKLQLQPSGNSIQYNNMNAKFKNIQIENNSNKTEYRPYRYIDVESRGKNLFSKNSITGQLNDPYTYIEASVPLTLDYYNNYLKGKELTISCKTMPSDMQMAFFIFGQRVETPDTYYGSQYGAKGTNYKTFTISSNINFSSISSLAIRFWRSEGSNNETYTFENIQLEESPAPTSYEPYIPPSTTTIDLTGHEPLRKIGDIADYIDYKNGKLIKKIGSFVLDGTETDYKLEKNYSESYRFSLQKQSIKASKNNHNSIVKSNKFKGVSAAEIRDNGNYAISIYREGSLYQQIDIRIPMENNINITNDPNTLKSWLAEQYANGTPVTVYYQLEKPIIEDIDLPELPLNNGTTVLTVNGTDQVNTFN